MLVGGGLPGDGSALIFNEVPAVWGVSGTGAWTIEIHLTTELTFRLFPGINPRTVVLGADGVVGVFMWLLQRQSQ